ncbi:MAG: molybdopterin cofactor-binding domain-containing protein [Acidimicrobiia bacterium]|nr:molybdopterin cofactor-binding domain-containing protein [Acidimicrobiia bacterium]
MTIGGSVPRVDAPDKVTGAARYPDDLEGSGALHAVAVFSGRAHARMTAIDLEGARALPGVVAVFTAADVPVNEYGLTMFDQPVMVGLDDTGRSKVPADVSRWEGDHVALVVAEDRATARAAAEAIDVTWEDLPVVGDVDAARAPKAPLVHPESGANTYLHYTTRRGDLAAGWEEADVVVEGVYEVPHQEHAYLQPEAATAFVDEEGRVTVAIAGQWTHEDRHQVAHALDLPPEAVRIVYPAVGGAFGGREDMSLQIVLALAALRLAERGETRPVRARWSREESIVGHHKRHRGRIRARWGARADGTLVAVEAEAVLDAGAYNYTTNKVLGNLHLTVGGPYRCPNIRLDSYGVYTTTVPGGAFRGFGAPQGAFAAESQMNKLAEALDMDPVEIRRRNLLAEGDPGPTHTPLPEGVSLREVVDACAEAAGWGSPPPDTGPVDSFRSLSGDPAATRRGRGFACGLKNIGFSFGFPERSEARIVYSGDRATLHAAAAEVGQGAHTVLRQLAADALDLPFDAVDAVWSDTASTGDSGSASASRLTFMQGNAILGAAEEARKAWLDGDRPAVGMFRYEPPRTEMLDPDGGPSTPNFAYGYVAEAVDASVDVETGIIRVDRVVTAVDVGRALNPGLIEGQNEGAVVQAHGYAVTEHLQLVDGMIVNPRLSQYLIPGIGDGPRRIETVLVEHPNPLGPHGVRGMAEMPYIPYAPALVAALHDATGVWFDVLPLTPDRVRAGLAGG